MEEEKKKHKKKAPIDTVLEVQDGLIDINLLMKHIDKGLEENNGKNS
jgi:hypothetical protein